MRSKRSWLHRKLVPMMGILLLIASAFLISCTGKNSAGSERQLRQQAEQATETVKQQSKEALAGARTAAGNAEEKVNAIAGGVKEGIETRGAKHSSRVDINTASISELESLPGVSASKARQIVDHRPYNDAHQLVDRGLLTQAQYDAEMSRISVR